MQIFGHDIHRSVKGVNVVNLTLDAIRNNDPAAAS